MCAPAINRWLFSGALAVAFMLFPVAGQAQRVRLSTDGDIYTGLPFVLSVAADGFDESPEPKVEDFAIAGARVDFVGVTPNVATSVTIINGRRSRTKRVTFVYRYKVTASKPGNYNIPPIKVSQGNKKASSQGARFSAKDIETTSNMRLELGVPERPVWVGEAFELTIDWLLRSDPNNPSFVIPLFEAEDQFRVVAPEPNGRRTLGFLIGDRELELPYERSQEKIGGVEYSRFRFTAIVTPQRAGTIELPAATVVARLQVGYGRDGFGFRTARRRIFKAESPGRKLEVRPLPASGRPPSFAGAVGSRFSIEARASRTVVRVGDPIELEILVRGDGGLAGLKLPELTGDHALPEAQFDVPAEIAPGETNDDGTGKLFRVNVRLKSTEAREIPELPFSYFDPQTGSYTTVKTQPIALSIAGSSVVGAGDVISAHKGASQSSQAAKLSTVVDADLSLSSPDRTMRTVLSIGSVTPVLAALYALPLLLLIGRSWQLRTRRTRGESAELKKARRRLSAAIDEARKAPARDSASQLLAALRELGKLSGRKPDTKVIEKLETEGYKPSAASNPLDGELLDRVRTVGDSLAKGASAHKSAAAGAVLLMLSSATAWAATLPEPVASARALYSEALSVSSRETRAERFRAVATSFVALNRDYPDRPELLADWGSAALGARDFGQATLAYRRALVLDPGLDRAVANLAWLRANGPARRAPEGTSAADTLFFWHSSLTAAQKHLFAALNFAAAMLLLVPWSSRRRRRGWKLVAIIPALGTIALLTSVAVADSPRDAAVVVDGSAILRSADSAGAPPVQSQPPGAGTEARVSDRRDDWVRLRFGDGTSGWMRSTAVEYVVVRPDS
ncbi:MAG: BatD family protein [Deltaproteobacteria bacterium]|nr:BatD family protein [Deltaproteobacteria bacterium]